MEYINFSFTDYILFTLMTSVSVLVGIYFGCFGRKQTTPEEYLLGSKNMQVFPVAISLVTSTLSGVTLLGIPAEVYVFGTQFAMTTVGVVLMAFVAYYIFLPVFHNARVSSAFEYLELRFDRRIRSISSCLYTLSNIILLPVFIYGPSLAFGQVTGFNLYVVAPIMTGVCILYTSIGGFKAVVWTDTLQFIVTLCILTSILTMGAVAGGGLKNVWNISESGNRIEFFNMDPNPTIRSTFWTIVVGDFFSWISHICVTPHAVQRFMSIPTLKSSRRALLLFVLFTIFTKFICCFFGLIMYAKYFKCDPLSSGLIKKADQILPYYVLDVASSVPGLSGLFIAGLFSTSLSALSTYINTLSGICYTDFIAPWINTNTSKKTASNIIKLVSVLLGLLSIGLILIIARLGSILEITLGLNAVAAGPVLGLFLLGLLCPFANRKGAFWGVIVSTAFTSLMVVKTQIYIWNGDIRHVTKPLSTAGCNTTLISNYKNFSTFDCKPEEPFWIYNISFHYNFLIAALIVVVVGLLVSPIMNKSSGDVDLNLLAPIFQHLRKGAAVEKCYTPVEQEMQPIESSKMLDDTHKSENLNDI